MGMMYSDHYTELMRKFQKTHLNCGVTLRSKAESEHRIKDRLLQLQLEGKNDSKEYEFLSAILLRMEAEESH